MSRLFLGNGSERFHLQTLYVREGGCWTTDRAGEWVFRHNIIQSSPNVAIMGQNAVNDRTGNPSNPRKIMVQLMDNIPAIDMINISLKLSNVDGYNQVRGAETFLRTSVYMRNLYDETELYVFIIPLAEGNFKNTESEVFYANHILTDPFELPQYVWVTMALQSTSNASEITFNCAINLDLV